MAFEVEPGWYVDGSAGHRKGVVILARSIEVYLFWGEKSAVLTACEDQYECVIDGA